MRPLDNCGFALVAVLMMFTIAFLGLFSLTQMGGSHLRTQALSIKSTEAFYLSEAAISRAKINLATDFTADPVTNEGTTYALGDGEYQFSVSAMDADYMRVITGIGAYPDFTNTETTHTISVGVQAQTVSVSIDLPYAIFSPGDVNINGKPHVINGDVEAGDEIDCAPACAGITGTQVEHNDDDYPIPVIDLAALKAVAQSQGNYYAASDVSNSGAITGAPTTFYYTEPTEETPGVANIVFVESDLAVGGNDSIGGLIIVVGDYMTNPNWDEDSTGNGDVSLGGNAFVDGFIYALDEVTKNGGGNSLNVEGGIVAWDEVTLNGRLEVNYNAEYANVLGAVETVSTTAFNTLSWNDQGQS